VIARLARVGAVALDARFAARTDHPAELARAAAWIAGNLLAARGVRVEADGELPDAADPRVVAVRADDLAGLLAALSRLPALIDAGTLPVGWRAALRAIGVPVLDRPVPEAIAGGASVAVLAPPRRQRRVAAVTITVTADALGYRVGAPGSRRSLLRAA